MSGGRCSNNLGMAYSNLGDVRRAIQYYERALEIHREFGNRRWEANSLVNLGKAYLEIGDARKAIEYYEQGLEIDRELGDRRAEAGILMNLGMAYAELPRGDRGENLRKAIGCYEAALRVRTEDKFPAEYAQTQANMGIAFKNLGDQEAAIGCWGNACCVYTSAGNNDAARKMLVLIANAMVGR